MTINPFYSAQWAPLAQYINPNIEELVINRPGEIVLKPRTGAWQTAQDGYFTLDRLNRLLRVIANVNAKPFGTEYPLLEAGLPGGERLQAVTGAAARYSPADASGIAIAIRNHAKSNTLDVSFAVAPESIIVQEAKLRTAFASDVWKDDLSAVVKAGLPVVIVGNTGSGKSTLMAQLIAQIPHNLRLVLIGDVQEIAPPHPNRTLLTAPRGGQMTYTHDDLLEACLRLRPDVILVMELGLANAFQIYRLMSSGHANFITTMHSDSPETAEDDFAATVSHAARQPEEMVRKKFTEFFARLIVLKRTADGQIGRAHV